MFCPPDGPERSAGTGEWQKMIRTFARGRGMLVNCKKEGFAFFVVY